MLDWLTTIPGILIIFGIVLLVIAIILFITGAKRPKKEVVGSFDNNNFTVMNNGVDVNTVTPVTPVVPLQNNVESSTVANINNQEVTPVINTPEISNVNTQEVTSTVNNQEVPNINIQENVPSLEEKEEIPVFQPSHIEEPEVSIVSNVEVPSFNNQVENSAPVFDIPEMATPVQEVSTPVTEEATTIYGGEVPTVDFTAQEEKPVTIYGGNDPLEATQTLPKIDEHYEPYSGGYPEVKVVDSLVQEPVVTPVEESLVQEPVVTPVEDSIVEIPTINPIVIDTPVEEPVINNTTVTPVEVNEPVIEEL